jgi:hypothetical protein
MAKLSRIQREELRQHVIDSTVRRLSLKEMQRYVTHKMNGVEISTDYLRHLRANIKKDTETDFNLLRKDRYAYLDELVFDRVKELKLMQRDVHLIMMTEQDNDIRLKAVETMQSLTDQIRSIYGDLLHYTTLYTNPTFDNTAAGDGGNENNNNTTSINNYDNNKSWFCAGCNGRHKDQFGFHCPERIVGLDEESQPGYFGVIKEENDAADDPNKKF